MLDQYIDPDHALALMLTLVGVVTIAVLIVTGRREDRRREQASSSTAVDDTLPEAASQAQGHAPAALRGVRQARATRAQVARRAQAGGIEGWAAYHRQHGRSAHQLQPAQRREAGCCSHQCTQDVHPSASIRDAVVTR